MKIIVELDGNYRWNIYQAARKLIAQGASEGDTVETWRGGKLSMSGNVGKLAKLVVRESHHGKPSFELAKWKAFPTNAVAVRNRVEGVDGALPPRHGKRAEFGAYRAGD
jgi:hypothetical protein